MPGAQSSKPPHPLARWAASDLYQKATQRPPFKHAKRFSALHSRERVAGCPSAARHGSTEKPGPMRREVGRRGGMTVGNIEIRPLVHRKPGQKSCFCKFLMRKASVRAIPRSFRQEPSPACRPGRAKGEPFPCSHQLPLQFRDHVASQAANPKYQKPCLRFLKKEHPTCTPAICKLDPSSWR